VTAAAPAAPPAATAAALAQIAQLRAAGFDLVTPERGELARLIRGAEVVIVIESPLTRSNRCLRGMV
jgi:hypothetical protein